MALSQSHSHPVRPKPQRPLVTMEVTGAPREVSWQHSRSIPASPKTPPGCSALQQPEDHHKKRRRCESLVVLTLGLSQPYLHHIVKRHNIPRPSQNVSRTPRALSWHIITALTCTCSNRARVSSVAATLGCSGPTQFSSTVWHRS